MTSDRIPHAIALMDRFAGRGKRYLWTDAFAVTNYLALAEATLETRFLDQAQNLIEQVHQTLARHRPDSNRAGWLSGLPETAGAAHPTVGGMRIGKSLDERDPSEPFDERLEWERDGQYFHYLTKWMHALDQTTRFTGEPSYNCWARELAHTAHRAFVYRPSSGDGPPRMYWKMSIDLTRPLVASMGQHDPLDGYVTCVQLQDAPAPAESCSAPPLDEAVHDFAAMLVPERFATEDPLGIGGLLFDAYRLAQLGGNDELVEACLRAALAGLVRHVRWNREGPAARRLAFRELGLAIGLAAVERLPAAAELLGRFAPLRETIEAFWLRPESQRAETWLEHVDINTVMLATSLMPEGFLTLHSPGVSILNPVPGRQHGNSG